MNGRLAHLIVLGAALQTMSCGVNSTPTPVPAPRQHVEPPQQAGGVQAYAGEVLGVDRVPSAEQNRITLSLRVSPQSDRVISVDLGPGWYFDEQGVVFSPHDPIVVKGSQSPHGEPTLVATEIEVGGQIYTRSPTGPNAVWKKKESGATEENDEAPKPADPAAPPNTDAETAPIPPEESAPPQVPAAPATTP